MLDNIINIKLLNVVKTTEEWERSHEIIPLGMMCIEKSISGSTEDTSVYYHDDQVHCSIGGREYYRINNDPAWCFVGVLAEPVFSGPVSISLTQEGAMWGVSGMGTTGDPIPFTYNGVTMYHSDTGSWMGGSFDDAMGNLETVTNVLYGLPEEWCCSFLESIIGPDPYNPQYVTSGYVMKIKIGDGEKTFSELDYFTGDAESLCKLIYGRGMEIESGTDLNDITLQRQYFCTGENASTLANSPVTDKPFSIIVRELTTNDSSNIRQEIYLADDASTVLSRVKYNNTWSGWYVNQATPLT